MTEASADNTADIDQFNLNVGDTLQLQFVADEQHTRHYVKLVGYRQNLSLLVTTPRAGGNIMLVRESQAVVVRLLAGSSVYGFNSTVLRVCARPYPYLHLNYPRELQQIVVRKSQRARVKLIGSLRNHSQEERDPEAETKPVACLVEDLSTTGALVSSNEELGEANDLVSIIVRLKVGTFHDDITLPALIRNIRERNVADQEETMRRYYGIEFQFIEQEESMVLYAFVYQQIATAQKG